MKNFSLKLDKLKNLTAAESGSVNGGTKVSVADPTQLDDGKTATLACPSQGRP